MGKPGEFTVVLTFWLQPLLSEGQGGASPTALILS